MILVLVIYNPPNIDIGDLIWALLNIDISDLIWASSNIDIGHLSFAKILCRLFDPHQILMLVIWASPNIGRSLAPHPFRPSTAVPAAFILQLMWSSFDPHEKQTLSCVAMTNYTTSVMWSSLSLLHMTNFTPHDQFTMDNVLLCAVSTQNPFCRDLRSFVWGKY